MIIRLGSLFISIIIISISSLCEADLWGDTVPLVDLQDRRTFSSPNYNPPVSEGGLTGNWSDSFSIVWNIAGAYSYDLETMLWTYEYRLSSDSGRVSHFILEVTEEADSSDIFNARMKAGHKDWEFTDMEGPGIWNNPKMGKSAPGWPERVDIYGIKFDEGSQEISYAFETTLNPVWGNFYVKGGKNREGDDNHDEARNSDNHGNEDSDKGHKWRYAYNGAMELKDFESEEKLNYIVRPGNSAPVIVPEPAGYMLYLTGSIIAVCGHFIRKLRFRNKLK